MLKTKLFSLSLFALLLLKTTNTLGVEAAEFFETSDLRNNQDRWDQVLRGFRKGHNFVLALALDSGCWEGQLPSTQQQDEVVTHDFYYRTSQYSLRFSYAFHIQIGGGLGYYLGTQFGSNLFETADSKQNYRRARMFSLPGILAGLVYDVSPTVRVLLGVGAHLKRIDKFYAYPEKAVVTARVVSPGIKIDYFLTLSDGLRLEYEDYLLKFRRSDSLTIKRKGKSFMLGWVRHLI